MISIYYSQMLIVISAIWLCIRIICWVRNKRIDWKREATLILVYICLIVVVRFTFCPFSKVNGKIQPLLFDRSKILPLRVNLKPFVYLFDYPIFREALINFIGNITMFIPLGIIWPSVFKELNTSRKAISAGVGVSLCIEILQLLFYERATDIDDLILNSIGFIIGYIFFVVVKKWKYKC